MFFVLVWYVCDCKCGQCSEAFKWEKKEEKRKKRTKNGVLLTPPSPSVPELIQGCAPTGDFHVQTQRSVPALSLIITQRRRYLWHRFSLCVCFFVCFTCRVGRRSRHVQSRLFFLLNSAILASLPNHSHRHHHPYPHYRLDWNYTFSHAGLNWGRLARSSAFP